MTSQDNILQKMNEVDSIVDVELANTVSERLIVPRLTLKQYKRIEELLNEDFDLRNYDTRKIRDVISLTGYYGGRNYTDIQNRIEKIYEVIDEDDFF